MKALKIIIILALSIDKSNAQLNQDSILYNIETNDGNEFLDTKVFFNSRIPDLFYFSFVLKKSIVLCQANSASAWS